MSYADEEAHHVANAVASLETPAPHRWKPSRAETMAAIETLLLSDISRQARIAIRDVEFELTHGREAA